MKRVAAILVFVVLGCNDDQDCFTIISKSISDGEFVFAGDFDTSGNGEDGPPNGFADINLTVSQEVYNAYDVGDEYCYE